MKILENHDNLVEEVIDENSINSIETAVTKEDIETIKKLLRQGDNINQKNFLGLTPLHYSIRLGRSNSFIAKLLELGANPNIQESIEGRTPLYDAAWSENEFLVSILLEYGAIPNICDKDKWTPLFCSAWRGHVNITNILLNYGANTEARDIYKKTPLTKAIENKQHNVVNILKIFKGTNISLFKKLVANIKKRNLQSFESIIANGFLLNFSDDRGETLLMHAVKEKNIDIISLLLTYGARVNRFDYKGNSALIYAMKIKNKEIIELLLQYGANPLIKAKSEKSAIEISKSKGDIELLKLFSKKIEEIYKPLDNLEWGSFKLERQEVQIPSQEIVEGDIIIDSSLILGEAEVLYLLPRTEMKGEIVLAIDSNDEEKKLLYEDIVIPYNQEVKVSRVRW